MFAYRASLVMLLRHLRCMRQCVLVGSLRVRVCFVPTLCIRVCCVTMFPSHQMRESVRSKSAHLDALQSELAAQEAELAADDAARIRRRTEKSEAKR